MSAPVDVMTRAVNVEALKPWSTVEDQVLLDGPGTVRDRVPRPVEHVEVVGGVRQVDRAARPGSRPSDEPVQRGDEHGGTAAQSGAARRAAPVGVDVVTPGGQHALERGEQRQRGAQPRERAGAGRAIGRGARSAATGGQLAQRRRCRRGERRARSASGRQSPSTIRYQTSSKRAGLGELGRRVLAVVVEALAVSTSPSSVSATMTPLRPRGTSSGVPLVMVGISSSASFTVQDIGIGNSLSGPAIGAILPTLVPKQDLPGAVSLQSVQMNLSRVIGPSVRRSTAVFGIATVFGINADVPLRDHRPACRPVQRQEHRRDPRDRRQPASSPAIGSRPPTR